MQNLKTVKQLFQSPLVFNQLNPSNQWWAQYIYHFSHVVNIASILNTGKIISREKVNRLSLQYLNDNANREVIGGTSDFCKNLVRFYFRPLTPTQFRNEGIKSKKEISNSNLPAHCPVPVFLLFDLDIFDEPGIYFSYESLASHYPVKLYNSFNDLCQAPFHDIYHSQPFTEFDDKQGIIKRRHAEIVIQNEIDLKYLKAIYCRNYAEALTLIDLLNPSAKLQWQNKIQVIHPNYYSSMFNQTLQITEALINQNQFIFKFNRPSLETFHALVQIEELNGNFLCSGSNPNFVLGNSTNGQMDIHESVNIQQPIRIKIIIDDNLVYSNTFNIF
ncbi:DarT ssDNA thymidine ADP-ribosyltransferase family protein [Lysinibacillus capsici]|uniref:DarT ssDNA thymidine ADP-ribosyltransferase family protein n=1 Tax=Lysinibacillus capsici TaxID=2115968 RepID=UPI002E1D21BE|nr:DarT ssDNA thymidine ADP-ribosyltransferase family protein [Lysinibacillus capsici]